MIIRSRLSASCLALGGAVALQASASAREHAKALWSFDQSGYVPAAGLTVDRKGNLFGTTELGGTGQCAGGIGCGTVYQLSPPAAAKAPWTYNVLYNFQGTKADGGFPQAALTIDSGVVYGYSVYSTEGTVFTLTPPAPGGTGWTFQTLYTFSGGADGSLAGSYSPLILTGGHIFGIAATGASKACGQFGCGTLFRLDPGTGGAPWTETTLYSFTGQGKSGSPTWIVGPDSNQALYVSTSFDNGAVWQFVPSGGQVAATIIANFNGKRSGSNPGNLVLDTSGNVYGLIAARPASAAFELMPPSPGGTSWTESILATISVHRYGATSLSAGLNGTLLGTIYGDVDFYPGSVFQLAPPSGGTGPWTYSQLWGFAHGPDRNPLDVEVGQGREQGKLFGVLDGGDSTNGSVYELHSTPH